MPHNQELNAIKQCKAKFSAYDMPEMVGSQPVASDSPEIVGSQPVASLMPATLETYVQDEPK